MAAALQLKVHDVIHCQAQLLAKKNEAGVLVRRGGVYKCDTVADTSRTKRGHEHQTHHVVRDHHEKAVVQRANEIVHILL